MWAISHSSLHSSTGGESATAMANHPIENASTSNRRIPRPYPACRHSRATPAAYTTARIVRLLASIDHPLWVRIGNDRQREERRRPEPKQRHETRARAWTAAVGLERARHVLQRQPRDATAGQHEDESHDRNQMQQRLPIGGAGPVDERIGRR